MNKELWDLCLNVSGIPGVLWCYLWAWIKSSYTPLVLLRKWSVSSSPSCSINKAFHLLPKYFPFLFSALKMKHENSVKNKSLFFIFENKKNHPNIYTNVNKKKIEKECYYLLTHYRLYFWFFSGLCPYA